MRMKGLPVNLDLYRSSKILTNKHFNGFKMPDFEMVHLPESMRAFTDLSPLGEKEFILDDNRGAVFPSPSLSMDGTDPLRQGSGVDHGFVLHQLLGKTKYVVY